MSLFAKLNQPVLYQPPSLPAPTRLAAAARRILSRWPDVVADPPEHDRERLVTEMLRRLSTGDWKGARMSFVTSAARALFDAERRSRPALEPLRRFYCGEIEASDSRTFLAAMIVGEPSSALGSRDTHGRFGAIACQSSAAAGYAIAIIGR